MTFEVLCCLRTEMPVRAIPELGLLGAQCIEPAQADPSWRDHCIHLVKCLAVAIYHSKQPRKHRTDVALGVPHEQKAGYPEAAAHDQLAKAFVFSHQRPMLPYRAFEDSPIAHTPPCVAYGQDVATRASKPLRQTTIETFFGEKSHAASGWPNWMSSLRR
jgi:hypothetical protein